MRFQAFILSARVLCEPAQENSGEGCKTVLELHAEAGSLLILSESYKSSENDVLWCAMLLPEGTFKVRALARGRSVISHLVRTQSTLTKVSKQVKLASSES